MVEAFWTDVEPDIALYCGDNRIIMPELEAESVDSIVTDPPYELGFMGKGWDRSGIAYDVSMWRECLRVLRPGGHLLAFGGSRTYHRLACAIEDAGFEIRDQIQWIYGSGFPKSLDVSKAIDARGPNADFIRFPEFAAHYAERRKAAGMTHAQICELGKFYGNVNHGGTSANWELGLALPTVVQWEIVAPVLGLNAEWRTRVVREQYEREIVGTRDVQRGVAFTSQGPAQLDVTLPGCDASRQWNGWGTALKPAHEPIVLARKPLIGTVAENVLQHGTGGLNIDRCRIGLPEEKRAAGTRAYAVGKLAGGCNGDGVLQPAPHDGLGRWPANVILSYPEDEYVLRPNVTPEQKKELFKWLYENA